MVCSGLVEKRPLLSTAAEVSFACLFRHQFSPWRSLCRVVMWVPHRMHGHVFASSCPALSFTPIAFGGHWFAMTLIIVFANTGAAGSDGFGFTVHDSRKARTVHLCSFFRTHLHLSMLSMHEIRLYLTWNYLRVCVTVFPAIIASRSTAAACFSASCR